ncbi:MAG: SIS domain-containing protein [Erysipelotrichaceae bacterium]|nr:SIS domain-containing protein [Erysipelotrichaceae bacterium]MBR5754744.1 SIS domain-containing protein [Erysipelotrichaceae bacterium]
MLLNHNEQYWEDKNAIITASEINQQPRLWRVLADELTERKEEIVAFMEKMETVEGLRTAFTGAGSSAFIGEAIQKILGRELGYHSETIHSTDVISYPEGELFDVPTLLISYARSGESPESVAAVKKAQEYVKELYNLVFVCKEGSSLYDYGSSLDDSLVLLMPEGSSDRGFAMTSSVSCMMLATYVVFGYREFDERCAFLRDLADSVEAQMDGFDELAAKAASWDYDRCIFLGLGGLKGLAHEASIKTMELTNGAVMTNYEGSTGFRHGPKTVIKEKTLTVHLISEDPFTKQYDLDLLNEVNQERKGNKTLVLTEKKNAEAVNGSNDVILYSGIEGSYSEMSSYINCLIILQLLSLEKSVSLGCRTDSPSVGGEVNRVVKGVVIH